MALILPPITKPAVIPRNMKAWRGRDDDDDDDDDYDDDDDDDDGDDDGHPQEHEGLEDEGGQGSPYQRTF